MTVETVLKDSQRRYDDAKRSHEIASQVGPLVAHLDGIQNTEVTNLFVTDERECWVGIRTTWFCVPHLVRTLTPISASLYNLTCITTIDATAKHEEYTAKGYTGNPIASCFIRTDFGGPQGAWRKIEFTWFTEIDGITCKVICELPHDITGMPLYAAYKPPVRARSRTATDEGQKAEPGYWYWTGTLTHQTSHPHKINYGHGPCYYWVKGTSVPGLIQNTIETL